MKRNLFLILFVFCSITVLPQQVPQFSQNMFNKLANNPAFAGSRDAISTTVLQRSQYMGFEGGPTTLNLSVDAPISLLHGGVGLNIIQDKIGEVELSTLDIKGSYAYTTELGSGQLGIGLSFGIVQTGIDITNLRIEQQNDQAVPVASSSGSVFDLGGGLYYNSEDVYMGLSSTHLAEPTIETDDGDIPLERHYFLIAGYYYYLNPNLSLNPSIYLKSDGASSQLDINSNIIYDNKIWGGLSYRHAENLSEGGPELAILTGMNITSDLKFGIAYDIVLSSIGNNSLEFMLGYDFKIKTDKDPTRYKNPRFL